MHTSRVLLVICQLIYVIVNSVNGERMRRAPRAERVHVVHAQHMVYIENFGEPNSAGLPPRFCNGALIGPDWVLTSANCVHSASADDLEVYGNATTIGDSHAEHTSVRRVYISKSYMERSMHGDVALLHLTQPLTGRYVAIAALSGTLQIMATTRLAVYSYGLTDESLDIFDRLKLTRFKIFSRWTCMRICGNISVSYDMICSRIGSDYNGIRHDSGAPVLYRGTVVGMVTGACMSNGSDSLTVFTRLRSLSYAIQETIHNPNIFSNWFH